METLKQSGEFRYPFDINTSWSGDRITSYNVCYTRLLREQAINTSDVEKTDFTELSASFQINQGIARNQDLNMKSPLLRISGEGEVSLPAGQINYLLNTDLVNTSKGQQGKERDELTGVTVPIRIKGPLAKPSYSLDVASLIKQTGNAKLNEKKAQLEQKLTDKLNKKVGSSLGTELKKLF